MTDSPDRVAVRHEIVPADRAGQRLDNFLISQLDGVPRSLVYRLVRTGQVRVNGKRAKPMRKLLAGDDVRIPPLSSRPRESVRVPDALIARIRGSIIYKSDDILVVNKPAGLAVHGGSGLQFGLLDILARLEQDLRPVHRLDRPTSGLVAVARNHQAAVALQRAFTGRTVDKRYLALLSGELAEARISVNQPLKKVRDGSGQHRVIVAEDGLPACTHFKVLERLGDFSYVEVVIETGRTHQIRVHAAHIGHPVAGDDRYNQESPPAGLKRLFLHAHFLMLPWPEAQIFNAPLPDELGAVIDRLRTGQITET